MPSAALQGTITRKETRYFGRPGHEYRIGGTKVKGVTTLLSGGLPKPALVNWAARSVAEYVAAHRDEIGPLLDNASDVEIVAKLGRKHEEQRDAAAGRGTEVHRLADELLHGREVEVPPELQGYVDACVHFLDDWRVEPIVTEAVVASRQYHYCGTLDFVGRTPDGTVWLGDYKTSKSGIFGDVALQLAAYAHADVYLDADGDEHPVAELGIDKAMGVSLRPEGYEVHELAIDESVFTAFRHIAWVSRNVTAKLDDGSKRSKSDLWRSRALDVPLWNEIPSAGAA